MVSLTLMKNMFYVLVSLFSLLFLISCATGHPKPCSLGGQPARVTPSASVIGKRSCDQAIVDDSGAFLNDGKYYEWYLNDQIALVGEYKKGKKAGRWIEYDESGKIVSQSDFENGKEVPPSYELKKPKVEQPGT